MSQKDNEYNSIRRECWDNAHDCFGYSYIFSRRARILSWNLKSITTLGVIVPVLVGMLAVSYKDYPEFVDAAIWISIPVTILQFILSLFSIIWSWEDKLSHANEASIDHSTLYDSFERLGKRPPSKIKNYRIAFDIENIKLNYRYRQDGKYKVKDWENRLAHRAGLRQLQRECVSCNEQPFSMKSTNCSVCGDFSFKKRIFN